MIIISIFSWILTFQYDLENDDQVSLGLATLYNAIRCVYISLTLSHATQQYDKYSRHGGPLGYFCPSIRLRSSSGTIATCGLYNQFPFSTHDSKC